MKKGISCKNIHLSYVIFLLIVAGSLLADVIASKDPSYLDAYNTFAAPGGEFILGTDSLGRTYGAASGTEAGFQSS